MKRLQFKKTIFILAVLVFVSFFVAVLTLSQGSDKVSATEQQRADMVSEVNINNTYEMYNSFTAPQCQLSIGGESKQADDCKVILPSGEVKDGFTGFTINEYGQYTVKYSKTVEGVEYYDTKTFYVYQDAYRTDSVRSTCEYVEQIEMSDAEQSGLHLKLEINKGFYYDKPIPVSSLTGRGDFITFYPYIEDYYKPYNQLVGTTPKQDKPQNGATQAATRPFEIAFKLTDSADSDNYVVVTYSLFNSNTKLDAKVYALYHRAYANNQKARGWTVSETATNSVTTKAVEYNGVRYSVWNNDNYGTGGFNHGPEMNNRPCTLGFNAQTTEVKVSENNNEKLINVLNNYDIYGNDIFEGFKGDDVYLSIWIGGYAAVLSPFIEFDITSIGPYSGSELQASKFIDETAPVIDIDFDLDSVNVAQNAKFYPPSYQVSDQSALAKKEIRVYTLSGTQKTYVDVVEDYFVPTELGDYYLEYYAQDVFGNQSTKTIKLVSKFNNGRGITFSSTKITSANFGERVELPSYSIGSLNNAQVEVTVKSPKGYVKVESDNSFIPNCLGAYTINYNYFDEIYSYNLSYDFEVLKSNNYIIYEQPFYDTQYINNKYYALDKVYASTAVNKEEIKEAVTYVFEDGVSNLSQAKKIENGEDYLCEAESTVQFKVVYNDGAKDTIIYESQVIPVVKVYDGNTFKLEKYFILDNGSVSVDSAKTTLNFDGNSSSSTMDFIGNVLLSKLNIKFKVPTGKDNFKNFIIRVTDYYDSENYFDVKYTVYSDYYTCQINDYFVKSNIYEFTNNLYEVGYSNGVISILNQDKIHHNYNPNFTSEKAKLTFIVDGITGESAVEIHSINATGMTLNAKDVNAKPVLADIGLPVYVNKGEKLNIPLAGVSDLLNPPINEQIELTIVDPSNNNILKDFVMTEDYVLEFNKLGEYIITLNVVSQSVAYDEYEFYISCVDMSNPQAQLVGQVEGSEILVRVGEEVTLADCEVADDSTVTVYFRDAKGMVNRITDGKVLLDQAGTCTVFYYVLGTDNNLNVIYYNIRAIGE